MQQNHKQNRFIHNKLSCLKSNTTSMKKYFCIIVTVFIGKIFAQSTQLPPKLISMVEQSLKNYPFKGSGTYLILGKVVEEFGFPSLEVEKLAKLPVRPDKRY